MNGNQCKGEKHSVSTAIPFDRVRNNAFLWGLASLFWLIIQSGRKPSRLQYPCQRAAAANAGLFLLPLLLPFCFKAHRALKAICARLSRRATAVALIATVCLLSAGHLDAWYRAAQRLQPYLQQRTSGPVGKSVAGAAGMAAGMMTIPHAMALPSPHRVVSVRHSGATDWDFQCTGSGVCPVYYGDSTYVDQAVVDQMVERGLLELTGAESIQGAWETLLPDYQAGETVAIKVNFNDAIMGGGVSGYGDNDAYVDALPQIVNSIIHGLLTRGVVEEYIRVFDSSRYITDRFRALIAYPNIRYFDRYGNGADVEASTFDSPEPSADIDFTGSGYPAASSSHRISDVLVDSDYLINIPIMKKHGGAGITLALKNHLGSINGFVSGGHAMHNYFYLGGSSYSSALNPIVDINDNAHIRDKTVLIVGDALYAGWQSNNTPPQRWSTFDNDSPNMLFFSVDPVAVDSVMFDYIDREGWVHPASVDILLVAATRGLGVHERWNNDDDRQYSAIDYIEIDLIKEIALTKVIKSLQVLSGQAPDGLISIEDINSDGKIGLEEAIYQLQSLCVR